MTEIGGTAEPSPRKDVSGLIARRLDELAQLRGSEQAEQAATGRPLPAAVVLLRRLGEIEQGVDAASLDHRSRREFAILRYACGLAVLGELIRQDAELTVLSSRHRGRLVAGVLLVTEAQSEVVHALEAQRRHLAEAFPTVGELPLSPRQQEVVPVLAGRVGIRRPLPTERLALDPKAFGWSNLRAQREAATLREAAGPDSAAHLNVIVKDAGSLGSGDT